MFIHTPGQVSALAVRATGAAQPPRYRMRQQTVRVMRRCEGGVAAAPVTALASPLTTTLLCVSAWSAPLERQHQHHQRLPCVLGGGVLCGNGDSFLARHMTSYATEAGPSPPPPNPPAHPLHLSHISLTCRLI